MLKWDYQPHRRSRSWVLSILEARNGIAKRVRRMPSLEPAVRELLPDAYEDAVFVAALKTGLDTKCFPPVCPYSIEETYNREFSFLSLPR